jgi:hypothetical protein
MAAPTRSRTCCISERTDLGLGGEGKEGGRRVVLRCPLALSRPSPHPRPIPAPPPRSSRETEPCWKPAASVISLEPSGNLIGCVWRVEYATRNYQRQPPFAEKHPRKLKEDLFHKYSINISFIAALYVVSPTVRFVS